MRSRLPRFGGVDHRVGTGVCMVFIVLVQHDASTRHHGSGEHAGGQW